MAQGIVVEALAHSDVEMGLAYVAGVIVAGCYWIRIKSVRAAV